MLSARLTVVGGDAKAAEISLKLPTTIGRGRDVTLTLPHPLVSRKHCEIFERGGALFVRDLKSLNGTFVDSQRIDGTSELRPDQLLTVGTVTFRAHYSATNANVVGNGEDPLEASASHVLDMNEPASADSDSEINNHVQSIHDKKTTPGRQKSHSQPPAKPAKKAVRTARPVRLTETDRSSPVSSDILEEVPVDEPAPEHSVCAAMRKSGAAKAKKSAPVSLDEVRSLLPGVKPAAMASSINGLSNESNGSPLDDNEFRGVNVEETLRARVNANDSALGSFIRKMPR